jgi:hypothetical protein
MTKEYRDTSLVVADDGTATVEFREYENEIIVYCESVTFKDASVAEVAIKMFMSEYSCHDIFGDYDF